MQEIIAKISIDGKIELTLNGSGRLQGVDPMTAEAAAFLGRALLASAVAVNSPNAPSVGALVGDAHLPIVIWQVGLSNITGETVLILSPTAGIQLTFVMPPLGAVELGRALVAQGEGSAPPGLQRGTVH